MDSENQESSFVDNLDHLPTHYINNTDNSNLEELEILLLNTCEEYQINDDNNEEVILDGDESVREVEASELEDKLPILAEEEQGIIDSTSDPELRRTLILNRVKAMHLKEILRLYYNNLQMLNKYIHLENQKMLNQEENKSKRKCTKMYTMKTGKPYFKDKHMFAPEKNLDCVRKKENLERYTYRRREGPRWTNGEQKKLLTAVSLNYYKYEKEQFRKQICIVNKEIKNGTEVSQLHKLQNKLSDLTEKSNALDSETKHIPPLNCDENVINWEVVAMLDLNGRRTAAECEGMWNCYVHPDINKSKWTFEEDEKIKALVVKYECDWELVTKNLGTNRSPYLVFVHFHTDLYDRFKRGKFNNSEDQMLVDTVEKFRHGLYIPWSRVKLYFPERGKYQLYHRYKYHLEKPKPKKGAFSEAEDALLAFLVKRYDKDYCFIAQAIPHRTSVQLRYRYNTYLEKEHINLGNFTVEEDKMILEHITKHGQRYPQLAKELNRCRAHVRQRYLTLTRFMRQCPELSLEDIPRRKQSHLMSYHKERYQRLLRCLSVLEEFDGIPTLRSIERILMHIADNTRNKKWKLNESTRKTYKQRKNKTEDDIREFLKITCKLEYNKHQDNIDTDAAEYSELRIVSLISALGGNVNMLINIKDKLDCMFTKTESMILSRLAQNCEVIKRCTPETPTQSNNEVNMGPNLLTLAIIRGLLLYCHINSDEYSEDEATGDLSEFNYEEAKKQEEDKFESILESHFIWPGVLSKIQPEIDEPLVIEEQEIPRKPPGRPKKKIYPKILKMIEAKQKKRKEEKATTSKNNAEVDLPLPLPSPKKKRRPKQTAPRPEPRDEIPYIPKRSHVKAVYKSKKLSREALMSFPKDNGNFSTSTDADVDSTNASISIDHSSVNNQPSNSLNHTKDSTKLIKETPNVDNTLQGAQVLLKKVDDPKQIIILQELFKKQKAQIETSKSNVVIVKQMPTPSVERRINIEQFKALQDIPPIKNLNNKRPDSEILTVANKKPHLESIEMPSTSRVGLDNSAINRTMSTNKSKEDRRLNDTNDYDPEIETDSDEFSTDSDEILYSEDDIKLLLSESDEECSMEDASTSTKTTSAEDVSKLTGSNVVQEIEKDWSDDDDSSNEDFRIY